MVQQGKTPGSQTERTRAAELQGNIFDIQRFSVNDGPGIRTTVFFKGCPLRCLWCDNPESQSGHSQLMFIESLCTRCGNCVAACSRKANTQASDGTIRLNRETCQNCGRCAATCLSGARVISGKAMSLREVMEVIGKDEMFYRNSGGGVTASGGEPTQQPEFLKKLFRACHQSGIHTTLDTSGYVAWPVLKEILKHADLVYYDLKHINPEKHRQLTGVDNGLILDNARRISRSGVPMVIRLPMIPGYNDATENIKEIASFIASLKVERVDILPFHTLGRKKYDHLGMAYRLGDLKSYTGEEIARLVETFGALGLKVTVA